ncbi:MAG: DUF61 family protein [Candidatus Hydrothermarchaeaceae archaeon]
MEDKSFRILSKQLQNMNRHLAKSRVDLESLLKEEKPKVILRDGSKHILKKEELKKLASLLPESMHRRVRLPVYIELSSGKYGSGTARVSGEVECEVVRKVLGKDDNGDELFIYRPDMKKLRKELPTTTQYMFTL